MKPYIVAFIGNREVADSQSVLEKLLSTLEELFGAECSDSLFRYPVFYCGGYGAFSQIASDAIDIFRKRNPEIKSEKLFITPYVTPSYLKVNKYMKEFYDEIVYPPLENVPPKFAISRRNQWMIDRCNLLVAYMENPFGNTRKCVEYAVRKDKIVIFVDSGKMESVLRSCRRKKESQYNEE